MCRYSATLGSMERSSSYPLATTECSRARVIESPVAKSVTSHPRATRPSVMLPATVSQAPYCRGGVRHATGDRIATLLPAINIQIACGSSFRTHSGQYVFERDGGEAGSVVGQTIRNDQ